jgi:ABC-type sugar transport system ATPase subunit
VSRLLFQSFVRLENYFPQYLETPPGDVVLQVDHFTSPGKFQDVSFSLKSGEILGFAGLVGAGRTEVAEALFGLDPQATGTIRINDKLTRIQSPSDAVDSGLGLVPEDRKRHGLVLSMKSRENLSLPILDRLAHFNWISSSSERSLADQYFKKMRVRAPSIDTLTEALSGGNQQKIVLARWLAARCRVLILDEPTRGVDVGAKAEIHALIDELAREGTAIILISSELPEVINLSTRLLVMREGKLVSELTRLQANQETIMRLMADIPSVSSAAAESN